MTRGTDLEVRAGDLVFDGLDLVLVTGLDALAQSLRHRVLTPLGSDRYDTRYGLDVRALFTGPLASAGAARDVLRLNLVRAVGTDPRVREVSDVLVRPTPGADQRDTWAAEVRLVTMDGTTTALGVEVGP